MATLRTDFFPPDFTDWRIFLHEMVVTFHIALWGTVLAVICAMPFGLLARRTSRRSGSTSRCAG